MGPNDKSIRTLYIGGIDYRMNEDLIRHKFGEYGEILSVVLVPDRKCGFVTFGSTESAMNALFDLLYLNKSKCQLNWGKSKGNDHEKKECVDDNEKEEKRNDDGMSKADELYLKKQGILPPTLPPMPDPCVSNTAYIGKSSTQYKSMSAHYKEDKVSTK